MQTPRGSRRQEFEIFGFGRLLHHNAPSTMHIRIARGYVIMQISLGV
jgi:hypothetical protein